MDINIKFNIYKKSGPAVLWRRHNHDPLFFLARLQIAQLSANLVHLEWDICLLSILIVFALTHNSCTWFHYLWQVEARSRPNSLVSTVRTWVQSSRALLHSSPASPSDNRTSFSFVVYWSKTPNMTRRQVAKARSLFSFDEAPWIVGTNLQNIIFRLLAVFKLTTMFLKSTLFTNTLLADLLQQCNVLPWA